MSSLPFFAPPSGHAAVFTATPASVLLERFAGTGKLASVAPATRFTGRPVPEMVSTGIGKLDALTGGLPRGCLSEICGAGSSGRTSVLLAALAAATARQEVCALVDVSDAFDPASAAAANVNFEKLLWVRCGANASVQKRRQEKTQFSENNSRFPMNLERERVAQALRVLDLLLRSGGFGMVAIDLGDVPATARRIPLASWFRFQRAVENTPTLLFVVAEQPCAQTCASVLVKLQSSVIRHQSSAELSALGSQLSKNTLPPHAQLFSGFHVEGEVLRSRIERKPVQSANTRFTTGMAQVG